jgi:hypothetical protein
MRHFHRRGTEGAARRGAAIAPALAVILAGAAASGEPPRLRVPHPLRFDGDQSAPLARGSDATPLRLLREIYPDLRDAGNATRMRAIRNLDPRDAPMEEAESFEGGRSVAGENEANIVRVGDAALLIAAGVLVAARIAPRYHFLDAAFVQSDPGGPPWIAQGFAGPAGPVALIGDGHSNSSESFETCQLVGTVGGRLTLLHPGLFLYSWHAPRRGCPMEQVSHSLSHLALRPGGTLVATVREERTCQEETRDRPLGNRRFTIRFVWDGARRRYRTDTSALDAVSERVYRANNR